MENEILDQIHEIITELKEDRSIPRNVIIKLESMEKIFQEAGALMTEPSCAACLGGPADTFGRLKEKEVCISTTNRNFPGRMGGKGSEVYLASPLTVAASAVAGKIADPREYIS